MPSVLHPQVWYLPGAHRGEGARGRGGLALALLPQQASGAVRPHPAGVPAAGAHRGEGARGRAGLAVAVVAPAGDGAVRPQPAGVPAAGAQTAVKLPAGGVAWPSCCRPSRRRRRSSSARRCGAAGADGVKVPAGGRGLAESLSPQQARVPTCSTAAGEVVTAPSTPPRRRGAGEGARGRGGLAEGVVAPAGDGAVRPHAAGVVAAGAQRREGARGRRGLAAVVVAPAGDGAVRP